MDLIQHPACPDKLRILLEEEVSIDDITLELIVSQYTREAGVRQLERELGKLLRKTATTVASGTAEPPISIGEPAVRDPVEEIL